MGVATKEMVNIPFPDLGSKKLKVLAYHEISNIENFQNQINFLQNHYNLINIEQLRDFLSHNENLPEKPLLITSDDGDISVYQKAFPILKKKKIPVAVFVITELLNTTKPFWWDEIIYYLGEEKGNKKVWEVKEWTNHKRVKYLSSLRENRTQPEPSHRQLNSSEVLQMQKGGISICNHSHSHPMFNQCSKVEISEEMEESKKILDSLGLESSVFAYPNGNYSINAENLLLQNGVKMAFLFDHRINKGKINPLRISRLVVNDTTPMWKFKLIISGWHSLLLPMSRRIGKMIKSLKQV